MYETMLQLHKILGMKSVQTECTFQQFKTLIVYCLSHIKERSCSFVVFANCIELIVTSKQLRNKKK